MECRLGCAACCIIPSISSPLPKHPSGKEAGVKCQHLTDEFLCDIFDSPLRPKVCDGFKAEKIFCGENREEAFEVLAKLEGIKDWMALL